MYSSNFNVSTNSSLQCAHTFQVPGNQIDSLTIALDGYTLLCVSYCNARNSRNYNRQQKIDAWNIKTGAKIKIKSHSKHNIFSPEEMKLIAIAGNGQNVLSVDRKHSLICWNLQLDVQPSLRKQHIFDNLSYGVTLDPRKEILFAPNSANGLDLYNVKSGKKIATLPTK
jgi:WD40 repeat protein